MFAGNFAPAGWMFCDGSLLAISQNDVLFALIGTTYGGDGQSTFALPDLRGRVPLHMGQGAGLSANVLGQNGGVETVTLNTSQMPAHNHLAIASSAAGVSTSPTGNVWAAAADFSPYNSSSNTAMNAGALGQAGGSQPHDNMLPFVGINFIISLFGIFPSQA